MDSHIQKAPERTQEIVENVFELFVVGNDWSDAGQDQVPREDHTGHRVAEANVRRLVAGRVEHLEKATAAQRNPIPVGYHLVRPRQSWHERRSLSTRTDDRQV